MEPFSQTAQKQKKLGQFFLQNVKESEVTMKDIVRSIWNVSVMLLYSFQWVKYLLQSE